MKMADYDTPENKLFAVMLAKRQLATKGKINLTEIQRELFGPKKTGGDYAKLVASWIDEAGLTRTKRSVIATNKPVSQTKSSETNSVSLQEFTLWPQSIDIDPQGVRVIQGTNQCDNVTLKQPSKNAAALPHWLSDILRTRPNHQRQKMRPTSGVTHWMQSAACGSCGSRR
jgi:hypothetical protein